MYKRNCNNNMCRQCYKKNCQNGINKCENCGSVCCQQCEPMNIQRYVYLYHPLKQNTVVVQYNACTFVCLQKVHNIHSAYTDDHSARIIRDFAPPFENSNGDWKTQYMLLKNIRKKLMQHLIIDMCKIVIEYL